MLDDTEWHLGGMASGWKNVLWFQLVDSEGQEVTCLLGKKSGLTLVVCGTKQ